MILTRMVAHRKYNNAIFTIKDFYRNKETLFTIFGDFIQPLLRNNFIFHFSKLRRNHGFFERTRWEALACRASAGQGMGDVTTKVPPHPYFQVDQTPSP